VLGLLGGMAGAAEYEKSTGVLGPATKGMDAQSSAHVFIMFLILLGNAIYFARRNAQGRVLMQGFDVSHDPGVWIAALLTLFIFSFLYKDNPLYKFAEHLFVGVSAGYIVVQQFWQVLFPNLIEPMFFQPGTPDTVEVLGRRAAVHPVVHALLRQGLLALALQHRGDHRRLRRREDDRLRPGRGRGPRSRRRC
jgi:hypothetical protein